MFYNENGSLWFLYRYLFCQKLIHVRDGKNHSTIQEVSNGLLSGQSPVCR